MITDHTVESLRAFEEDIAREFNDGKIRAPIHLEGGNEQALLDVFQDIGPHDWIGCTWRSHLKCLLKGVPPAKLKAAIMAGRSISLCFPEHRVISSAIVGGIIPIAMGIAMNIKRNGGKEVVWCFVGEMTSETGVFCECAKYAENHSLPLRFVVEDNAKSVTTKTREVWNCECLTCESEFRRPLAVTYYRYGLPYPHAGAGRRVQF
jgi:TPP-dependent pyruvate/acetoin dehydrogenase alpha subunit